MNRGTTLITGVCRHLSCSVTGAPVPVIPGDLEMACGATCRGLPPSPLALGICTAWFPHSLCISRLFYHIFLKCQSLSAIFAALFCRFMLICHRHAPLTKSVPANRRRCDETIGNLFYVSALRILPFPNFLYPKPCRHTFKFVKIPVEIVWITQYNHE